VRSYPLACCGRTSALDSILRATTSNNVRTNANKICRLHLQGRCKFGKDCKNIHLCPQAKPGVPQVASAAAPVPAKETGISFRNLECTTSSCGMSTLSSPKKRSPSSVDSAEEASFSSSASQDSSPDRAVRPLNCVALKTQESVWAKPLSIPMASPNFECSGFESTLSLLCEDLAMLHVSPSFAVSPTSQFAMF